ncbi:MAG TPA: acyltransferase family protein [Burkholderiaceae bacterium]|nr:acyltransferase family protein [Burkholderiaceae bacterium]
MNAGRMNAERMGTIEGRPAAAAADFPFIDNAKAIGIVLVVLGHARGMPDVFYELVYSFHMPLFFALSGYLVSPANLALAPLAHLRRSLRTIGLPYLVFFAISYGYWLATRGYGARAGKFAGLTAADPLPGFVSGIGVDMIVNPVLWFFPCLFVVTLLYYLARRRFGAGAVLAASALLAIGWIEWLVPVLPMRLPYGLDIGLAMLVFYAAGAWARSVGYPPQPDGSGRTAAWATLIVSAAATAALTAVNGKVDVNTLGFGVHGWTFVISGLAGTLMTMTIGRLIVAGRVTRWLAANSLIIFPLHTLMFNAFSGAGKLLMHSGEALDMTVPGSLLFAAAALLLSVPAAAILRRLVPPMFSRHGRRLEPAAPAGVAR